MVSRPRLILASASPRRREILTALGIPFDAVVPDVEELTEGDPNEVVVANARCKALAGAAMARGADRVLGVDTEVVLDGRLLGKAGDTAEARERLTALSGRTHEVLSGVALVTASGEPNIEFVDPEPTKSMIGEGSPSEPDPAERSGVARSRVTFKELTPRMLEVYLASGEWRDRAGAYAVQGLGSILVERVEGDLSNVIGLPVGLLLELAPELLDAAGDSST